MYPTFDVVVVGGGPAGLALAGALRALDLTVCVFERRGFGTEFRPGEHLTPQGAQDLRILGADSLLDPRRHAQCTGVVTDWGSAVATETSYAFSPFGDGWSLGRPVFDQLLADWVRRRGGVVRERCVAHPVRRDDEVWEVRVESDLLEREYIYARVCVDASGRAAMVTRREATPPLCTMLSSAFRD